MTNYIFERDFSSDLLRWMNILEKSGLQQDPFKKRKNNNPQKLEKLQQEIIREQDPAMAYFFATEFAYKSYLMQKIIIDSKDAKYAFLFARVPNCDIHALQQIVLASKKIKYICKFACFVQHADLPPLEAAILKSKNVQYAHMYLKHVNSPNIGKFKAIILSSGKPRYLFELAKHLTNKKEIGHIEDLIIQSKSFLYMRLFAEKIKLANIEKLEQVVLATNNVKEIKKFATAVKNSKMRRFLLTS